MYDPPHYHTRVKLRNLTTEENEVYSYIPLIEKKKAIQEAIATQRKEEVARLMRELEMK